VFGIRDSGAGVLIFGLWCLVYGVWFMVYGGHDKIGRIRMEMLDTRGGSLSVNNEPPTINHTP
jgi:hypothetical protein